jgi:helicase MOV-10
VQYQGATDEKWFEGVVQDVHATVVVLQFARSFRPPPNATFAVRFTFNRIPLRRQHQALLQPFMEDRIFFPTVEHIKLRPTGNVDVALFNDDIANNPNQLLAVKAILNLLPGAHPLVVYGP